MSLHSINKYSPQFNAMENSKDSSSKVNYSDFAKQVANIPTPDLQKTLEHKNNFIDNIDVYLKPDTFKAIKSFQSNTSNTNNTDIIKSIHAKLTSKMKVMAVSVKSPKRYELPITPSPKNEI